MAQPLEDTHSDSPVSPVAVKSETMSRKRKADAIADTKKTTARQTEAEDGVEVTAESPRPKRRAAKKVKAELETNEEVVAQEPVGDVKLSSRSKRVSTKKSTIEENVVDCEVNEDAKTSNKTRGSSGKTTKDTKKKVDDGDQDKPKKVTKSKAKPIKILPPIAERTKDIKLRVGAHVSIAGGQLWPAFVYCFVRMPANMGLVVFFQVCTMLSSTSSTLGKLSPFCTLGVFLSQGMFAT